MATKKVQYTNKAGKTMVVETTDKNQKGLAGYYEGNKNYKQSPVESAKVAPVYYDTQYTNKAGKTYNTKTTDSSKVGAGASGAVIENTSSPVSASQVQPQDNYSPILDPQNYDQGKYYYSDSTKSFYDRNSGRQVDMYGNALPIGAVTEEQKIKDQANLPYEDLSKIGQDLFGADNPLADKGTFEKAILDKFKTRSAEDEKYLTEQQKLQSDLDKSELEKVKKSGEAAVKGTEASLYQGREGVQSATRPDIVSSYKKSIQTEIDNATNRFQQAEAARTRAQVELQRAQEDGATELIDMWRQNLQRAEMEIAEARTNMLNAEARSTSLALDLNADQRAREIQNIANFNAFSGLVEQGVNLTPDNILSFSKSLNIPFEDAYSYYQGMQSIRDDKSLTLEQKQIETQNLQQDFQDRMTGYQTKEAQKLRDYTRLVQSGQYTAEEAATMLNIPNDKNPIFLAEKRLAEANARIKENEANGILTNPLDVLEAAKLSYELGELTGDSSVYVPNGSIKSVPVAGGLSVNVADGTVIGSCGTLVNKITGQTVGNTYQEKLNKMKAMGGTQIPTPGMVFVQAAAGKSAPWGHVGIVERVNADGTVDIVESNYSKPNTVGRRKNVPITSFDGFYAPAGAEAVGGKIQSGYTESQKALMSSLDPAKLSSNDLKVLKENGLTSANLFDYISTNKKALPEESKTEIQEILNAIDELESSPGKSGAVGFGIQKIGSDGEGWAGTKTASYISKFNSFRDNLAIPLLEKLKGPLSDNDLKFLKSASTALKLNMDEESFDAELQKLKKKYTEILTQGTDMSEDKEKAYIENLNFDDMALDDYLNSLSY